MEGDDEEGKTGGGEEDTGRQVPVCSPNFLLVTSSLSKHKDPIFGTSRLPQCAAKESDNFVFSYSWLRKTGVDHVSESGPDHLQRSGDLTGKEVVKNREQMGVPGLKQLVAVKVDPRRGHRVTDKGTIRQ